MREIVSEGDHKSARKLGITIEIEPRFHIFFTIPPLASNLDSWNA
jgi:hypothetical protein